jgi:hypothetical protein
MQVAHQNDHVTHAVIGGKQNIEFGISSSAEFFNILSSTLYKDQILAVVREVLCNAWDAHIEAGCTDRPVQITLEQDKFVIKDFGKGIHHDDMGLIYGTYGNSTKKNDGQQTGGFGLGCKAPFAYTDHFEVISCHAGIKTIYGISKSSAQAMGKPGITPIASFATEDTGLTVTIRIKPTDFRRFNILVHRIVSNGDMNMQLNTKQLDTIGFDVSKGNYLITQRFPLDGIHRVMVRYGNVIYPVDPTKEIESNYTAVEYHLDALGKRGDQLAIIFQAPAHSIAVTPSRESLSMQEHTVNTLNTLLKGFLSTLETEFMEECTKYAEAVTKKAAAEHRIDVLLSRNVQLPPVYEKENFTSISDLATMAKVYLQRNYPRGVEYHKADITRRLELLVQENLLDRGKVKTFLLELKDVREVCNPPYQWHKTYQKTSWLQRRVIAPLMVKLNQAGMDTKRLFVCNSEDTNCPTVYRESVPPLVAATSACPHHPLAALPYLRNIAVITTRKHDLLNRCYEHDVFKKAGQFQGFLVYVAGRKKGEIEEARAFFAKQGVRVADLTVKEAQPREVTPRSTTPRKPAKKGIVRLDACLHNNRVYLQNLRNEDAARIESPEFVIKITGRTASGPCWENWSPTAARIIAHLFGSKGGVTSTSTMHDKWIAQGAKDFDEYLYEKVCSYILNNPRIEAYWAIRHEHVNSEVRYLDSLVRLIYTIKELQTEFKVEDPLTEEDHMYLMLWKEMSRKYYHTSNPAAIPVIDWLRAIPQSPVIQDLVKKLSNPLVSLLDENQVRNLLTEDPPSPHRAKVLAFFISVLNG